MKPFNVNDTIWVKLTEQGLAVHWKWHTDLWTGLGRLKDFPYTPPKVNEDGFSSFQLWVFMEIFGPAFGMLQPPVIKNNDIWFEEPK